MLSLQEFLARLDGVTQRGNAWMARCPGHDDQRQSLSIKAGTRQPIVLKCHARCEVPAILAAMSLTLADISTPRAPRERPLRRGPAQAEPQGTPVASYEYRDADGELRYTVVRYAPKTFRPFMPGAEHAGLPSSVEKILYRLDDLALLRPPVVAVVEGEKDADALWALGIPATTKAFGSDGWTIAYAQQLRDQGVQEIIAIPDNDVSGRDLMVEVVASWRSLGGVAYTLALTGLDEHGDASDFLARHGVEEFRHALNSVRRRTTLDDVHAVHRKWLGADYDLEASDAVLAAVAAHRLNDGVTCWIMVVSGPGAAKTETVTPLEGAGARIESAISSLGALLSGSPRRDRARDFTGGLLVEMGADGVLVLKDMTTILSMHRTTRDEVLAALREIHDGRWSRLVGTEGGRRLTWAGRLTVVAACTSAWDKAYDVVATMGDRFVIVRIDSRHGRRAAFAQSIRNNGSEPLMKQELASVVRRVMDGLDPQRIVPLTDTDLDHLFDVADATTLSRGGVELDYQKNVIGTDAPEAPTRFAKQLVQLVRGAMALGMSKDKAIALGVRCARDSIPPIRFEVLKHLSTRAGELPGEVVKALNRPRTTVLRTLDSLVDMRVVYTTEDRNEKRYHIHADVTKGILAMPTNVSSGHDEGAGNSDAPF